MGDFDFDLTKRESFPHWVNVTIRFSDQDAMAHVNNVCIAQYIEAARVTLVQGLIDRFDHPGLDFILARVTIDYRQELHYPGSVDVGARLVGIGNKSMRSGYGVFKGDACIATAESVNVFYDMNTRASTKPPDDVRAAVEAMIAGTD